ncbi:glycoside hydrolase family 3 C-terminal domain-containing protein [Streptomyces sp. NPDC003023]|uniref:glycoside hydrolase family 3 C-terminal domain-containing protein n=1 Tax=Streptomyces sp. NPDC003023 TaxID=3364675 RepID=UPI0036A2D504
MSAEDPARLEGELPRSEEEPARLVDKLDIRQKVRLLTGATTWRTHPDPSAGLAALSLSDGPAGVRGESWDERNTSALLPSASALAATWDDELVERLGGLLAAEARRKRVHVVLAPTLNLHRSPLAGRHFECFSEDPLLTGRTGAALIRGIQAQGVAATAKHYVANDSETERLTVDVRVDGRTLREVCLAPFEAAVEAGVWLVMAGYNGVNGTTMTESRLLDVPLRTEWGFDGVVVSDWGAVRSTVASALTGQDLVMPGPEGPWGEALLRAVREGTVPEEVVDEKVRRLLRLAARVGALDALGPAGTAGPGAATPVVSLDRPAGPPLAGGCAADPAVEPPVSAAVLPDPVVEPQVPAAALPGPAAVPVPVLQPPVSGVAPPGPAAVPVPQPPVSAAVLPDPVVEPSNRAAAAPDPEVRALLRTAAAAGAVLLRNTGVLPLDAHTLRSVAVIGPHAAVPRAQGGGSAGVFPPYVTTPLDGIREALGPGARVLHVPGPSLGDPPPVGTGLCRDPRSGLPGVLLRVLDAQGRELHAEHRSSGRQLEPPTPPGAHTVEIEALLTPDVSGEWTLGVGGFGRITLTAGSRTLVDGEFPRETDDPAVVHVNPPRHHGRVPLAAGRAVRVVARRQLAPGTGRATLLTAGPPLPPPEAALADAARAARDTDAAVVCVGTTEDGESEGHDRTGLALPGHQDALVRVVAAAGPRTVVLVNAGAPVEMPWRDQVAAVLLTWFPGQEGGAAAADVLFGRTEPGGRLPTTWGALLADAPVTRTRPLNGTLPYEEGLHIGHRAWARTGRTPAYWFGHGLGYTTWRYEDVRVRRTEGVFTVDVRVGNTGGRTGREVVQVYLSRPRSAVERPARWLAGYAAVVAAPGETVTASVRVPARALAHWSTTSHRWELEPGGYQVLVGRSAGDLPLTSTVVATEADESGGLCR